MQEERQIEEDEFKLRQWMLLNIEEKFSWKWTFKRLDPRLKRALLTVSRWKHLPEGIGLRQAYEDKAVLLKVKGLGRGKYEVLATVSEPSLVALMVNSVIPEWFGRCSRALVVGGGLGYDAALLKAVGFGKVWAVEIDPELVAQATAISDRCGYEGIEFVWGDGKEGLSDYAPYKAILVDAAVASDLELFPLLVQLEQGGKLVAPVAETVASLREQGVEVLIDGANDSREIQVLKLFQRVGDEARGWNLELVSFVKMQ